MGEVKAVKRKGDGRIKSDGISILSHAVCGIPFDQSF